MTNQAYILMDVGGTFIKSGLMSADNTLIEESQQTIPINSDGTKEEILNSLMSAVNQGLNLSKYFGYIPAGVGICMPGPFNYVTGISEMDHKFAAIKNIPLKPAIIKMLGKLDVPVAFGHDVNTQLYGEMCAGNAKGYKNVCLVALGTGLGFALASEGEVLQTSTGSPLVSIWNLPYKDGILEDYASKRGFYKVWEIVTGEKLLEENFTVADMGHLAGDGDKNAIEVFKRVGEIIGKNVKEKLVEYKIECLLFGGQISRSFVYMESAVKEELSDLKTLDIKTVSDFKNAAFNGLVEILKKA